jgi:DNA-binding NarL/FixJ family response regulator
MLSADSSFNELAAVAAPPSPEAVWRKVFSGGHRVVAWYDDGERRHVVVEPHATRADALTSRQRRIVAMRASGTALKVIGFETGLSVGTISRELTLAMDRLGLKTISDLAAVLGEAGAERTSSCDLPCPRGLSVALRESNSKHLDLSFPLKGGGALPAALTPAERAVVEAILAGLPNREIAEQRGVSPRTIANQISRIFEKLKVGSRLTLALCVRNAAFPVLDGARA